VNLSLLTVSRATTRDLAEWDDFNYSKPIGTIYHSNAWVKIHQRTLNSRVIQLVAREEGKLVGLFPFGVSDKTSFGTLGSSISRVGKEIRSPIGRMENPYGGPVCDGNRPDVLRSLLTASLKFCGLLGSFFIKFSPQFAENVPDLSPLRLGMSSVEMRETLMIGLDPPMNEIEANFRRLIRRGIKKAEASEVKVIEATEDSSIDAYHQILTSTYSRAGFSPYPREFYREVLNAFYPVHQASLLLALYNDKPIAGQVWLKDRTTAYSWTGGFLREFSRLYPYYLIQSKMIEKAKSVGLKFFDMTGIDPGHPGIAFFKAGFGGQLCQFPAIQGETSPAFILRRIRSRLRSWVGNAQVRARPCSSRLAQLIQPADFGSVRLSQLSGVSSRDRGGGNRVPLFSAMPL